jgi:hypothetical protein
MSTKEFKASENSKTLEEMEIKDKDKFSITAIMASSLILKLNLVFSDKTLTPEADRLFAEVFKKYIEEDGFMSKRTCTKFLQSCTSQHTDENDIRIKRLFEAYDKDLDGKISAQEFKDFYQDSIIKKESTVLANIRSWDYKTDLRKGMNRSKRSPKTLLRFGLPQNEEFFEYFFSLLCDNNDKMNDKNESVSTFDYATAKNSWELIRRLSVDLKFYKRVSNFESKDEESEFSFLDLVDIKNPFQVIYLIDICFKNMTDDKDSKDLALMKDVKQEYKKINYQTIEVIFNEDEPTPVPASAEPVYGPHLPSNFIVKGTSVGTGTESNTKSNVPAPTPAVPINKGHKSQDHAMVGSESGKGKATHVVSASNNKGNIPQAPPAPNSRRPDGTFSDSSNNVKFSDEVAEEKDNDKEGDQWYPPKRPQKEEKSENIEGEVQENYIEAFPISTGYLDEFELLPKVEWIQNFVRKGGVEFLLHIFLSKDSFIAGKINHIDSMTGEEKQCVEKILDILSILILTSNLANESATVTESSEEHLETVQEDDEINAEDEFHIDEEKLLKSVKNAKPMRERTKSSVVREDQIKKQDEAKRSLEYAVLESYKHAYHALDGELCEKILKGIPYQNFLNQSLSFIARIITKRDLSLNDKNVLSKILTVVQLISMFNEELLGHFYNFYDEETKMGTKEIMIKGLTLSYDAYVKNSFYA